jgi:phage gp37-like protein
MAAIWAGIDAGNTHHHRVAIDEAVTDLKILTGRRRRMDLVADRTRAVDGLGAQLTDIFPAWNGRWI